MATTDDLPAIGFHTEISQTTYAELISVTQGATQPINYTNPIVYGGTDCTAGTDGTFPITEPTVELFKSDPVITAATTIYKPPSNRCLLRNVYCSLEWVGPFLLDTRIFGLFLRYTIRQTPTQRIIVDQEPISAKRFILPDVQYSYLWKGTDSNEYNDENLINSINVRLHGTGSIQPGDTFECGHRAYIRGVRPSNPGAFNDIVNFQLGDAPNPALGILESIDIIALVRTTDSDQYVWQDIPYLLGGGFDDDSDILRATLQFDRDGRTVVASDTISTTNIYNNSTDSLGRWTTLAHFEIDTLSGDGIDQITINESTGPVRGYGLVLVKTNGQLVDRPIPLPPFDVQGFISIGDPCSSDVTITSRSESLLVNEVQSVTIPGATGGTFRLSFKDEHTNYLALGASAADLQAALEALSTIGLSNVTVTGSGTAASPYIITFRYALGSTNQPLLEGDSSRLTGLASATYNTISQGTFSEKVRITTTNFLQTFTVTFEGSTTQSLFRPSLNELQLALEALDTIGPGNIAVTAPSAIDRDEHYNGPWDLSLIGLLGDQNIPNGSLTVSPSSYSVSTLVEGGGASEIQTIKFYHAESGYAQFNFNGLLSDRVYFPTTADVIQQALENIPGIGIGNILVEEVDDYYKITFIDELIGTDVPQIAAITSNLTGGQIFVSEVTAGQEPGATVRVINLNNATSGTFALVYGGITTNPLSYICSADDIKSAILDAASQNPDITLTSEDFTVDGDTGAPGVASGPFTIEFVDGYFAAELSATNVQLECSTKIAPVVPVGPYGYDVVPDPELGLPSTLPSYNDATPNPSTPLIFQRDLYDPNTLINGNACRVIDVMLNKNLSPSKFIPYYRVGSNLRPAGLKDELQTGISIVAIHVDLDTATWRQHVLRHLSSTRNILPMRMVWPT